LEDGHLGIFATLKKTKPLNIDHYCDNRWQELVDMHPSLILENKNLLQKIE
jgi:hypothetical protein